MKMLMLLSDGHEECEALITYDILKRVGINVDLVSIKDSLEVTSSHNITYSAFKIIKDIDPKEYAGIILPGGIPGVDNLNQSKEVHDILHYFVANKLLVCAICAAPMILIQDGYLSDGLFTCYPGFEGELKRADLNVVNYKNFITASGLGAAFDFAKTIAEFLGYEDKVKTVLKEISYH